MRIKVKPFAMARAIVGQTELQIDLPEGATVKDAFEFILERFPKLAQLKSVRFSVNLEYSEPTTKLQDGDELALIPPVSGG
ncbi:TPA: MoaD/ThiS family protein [Candidatus Poribacteria bacterium]|nr:MoaD/ThiS family protein [Candidatus Poribacteria bacterium]